MADIQIKNTKLDSSNWVDMRGATFVPSYKRSNEAIPINGTQEPKVPEGDRIGIEPALITIKGYIDIDDFDSTAELWSETPSTLSSNGVDGVSNTNRMTMGYLLALWRENEGETLIKINFGDPNSQKTWKNWDNSSSEIYVVVDDVNPVPEQGTTGLHMINYSIVLREVVPDGTYTS